MYLLGPFYQWLVRLFDGRVNHLPLVRLFIFSVEPRNHPVSRMADRLVYLFILTEKRRNRLEVGALPKFIYLLYYIARAAHDFQKHQ